MKKRLNNIVIANAKYFFKKNILFLTFVTFLFVGNCALANEKIGLSVDQSILSFDIFPGESQNVKLNLKNISNKKEIVKVSAVDILIKDNNNVSILDKSNPINGMKDWIRINEKNVILNAHESREIFFSVNIPYNASVGSHYANIIFQVFPEVNSTNSQKTIVSGRLAVSVLINVKGEISGDGKIASFNVPIVSQKKIDIETEFQNLGNIHYVPYGEVRVKNFLTGVEEKDKLKKHFVFPKKKYKFKISKNLNPFFGVYAVSTYFVDGNGEVHISKRYVVGLYFVIIIVILMLFLLWIFFRRLKDKE